MKIYVWPSAGASGGSRSSPRPTWLVLEEVSDNSPGMSFNVIDFGLLLGCLLLASGESPSKHFRGRLQDDPAWEYEDPCKTVRTLPRIVGGKPVTSDSSAPYVAAIGERLSNGSITWFCGGSILSPFHVLTAAHCLISRSPDVVRVGSLWLNRELSENDYNIIETVVHPGYKSPTSYHDVAVVKLGRKLVFVNNIRPVCLAKKDRVYRGKKARVVGWGAEKVGGDASQKLQQVEVEVFSNDRCDQAYQNSSISTRTFPDGVQDGQLCAGSQNGGKDACQGDSGGPLVLEDGSGIVRQIGVVSTGAGCGAKVYPGVYSRVSTYHGWIQEEIRKNSGIVFRGSSQKQSRRFDRATLRAGRVA